MANKRIVRFKCPYCEKSFERAPLVRHVGDEHDDMIPEGYTPLRVVFDYVNKYPAGYNGKCTECKGPTGWDENKGRYNRQCGKQACHDSYIKKFEENMNRTKGVTRISQTEEGQKKMLANRKISGTYKFQNGKEKTYCGKNELKALQFEDKVMNLNPDDLMCPGPVLEYEYNGEMHMYITDQYYIPYNLVIEVKDGGNNPNKRDMPEYRAKQIAKEEYIIKHTNYNYLRLTDNDLSQLLSVFMDLKLQLVENSGERVIHVNEAMNALMTGYIPGWNDTGSAYIVDYMQNNVFSGEPERELALADSIKLDNMIARDSIGVLRKTPKGFLENAKYNVYMIDRDRIDFSKLTLNEFCSETQFQEAIFGQKIYTNDQIQLFEFVVPVIDFYKSLDMIREGTINYIKGVPKNTFSIGDSKMKDITTGKVYTEANTLGMFLGWDEMAEFFLDSIQYIKEENIIMNERYFINEKDIYYHKKEFDSKQINLCFITGHSGSGKSTMASNMESKDIEKYELDDVLYNKIEFTMDDLKEYGDLIYTFFKGPGKKYYYDEEDVKSGRVNPIGDNYEELLFKDFINYSIKFAKSYKEKQYVIEGIWLFMFIEPELLKDYAVYIKGTSRLISDLRAAKRDCNNDNYDGSKKTKIERTKSYIKRLFRFLTKNSIIDERKINKYRQYFKNLMKEEN